LRITVPVGVPRLRPRRAAGLACITLAFSPWRLLPGAVSATREWCTRRGRPGKPCCWARRYQIDGIILQGVNNLFLGCWQLPQHIAGETCEDHC